MRRTKGHLEYNIITSRSFITQQSYNTIIYSIVI